MLFSETFLKTVATSFSSNQSESLLEQKTEYLEVIVIFSGVVVDGLGSPEAQLLGQAGFLLSMQLECISYKLLVVYKPPGCPGKWMPEERQLYWELLWLILCTSAGRRETEQIYVEE